MLTQDLLHEVFIYTPDTGKLIRRVGTNKKGPPSVNLWYPRVCLNGKTHDIHRIIWLMVYGVIPKDTFIDHINGDKRDNRLANLRLASRSGNSRNSKLPVNNTSGFKGVTAEGGSYRARLLLNGVRTHVGLYPTATEAATAYDSAALEHYGEFARTNKMMGLLPDISSNV